MQAPSSGHSHKCVPQPFGILCSVTSLMWNYPICFLRIACSKAHTGHAKTFVRIRTAPGYASWIRTPRSGTPCAIISLITLSTNSVEGIMTVHWQETQAYVSMADSRSSNSGTPAFQVARRSRFGKAQQQVVSIDFLASTGLLPNGLSPLKC